jgi:mannose/fructose/N-acetylgalactosamine-specific phosphotransferase system component IID
MRRSGISLIHLKIAIVWALSGMVLGSSFANTLYSHFPAARAGSLIGYFTIAVVAAQIVILTFVGIQLHREKKEMLADYDAMLDRIKDSLLAENPADREAISQYIGNLRRSIPR